MISVSSNPRSQKRDPFDFRSVHDRVRKGSLFEKDIKKVVVGRDISRIEFNSLPVGFGSIAQTHLMMKGVSQAVICIDEFRIEIDGPFILPDGVIESLQLIIDIAQEKVGRAVFRVEFASLLILLKRMGECCRPK